MARIVESKRFTNIYTLSHPITQEVRYVGKTVASLPTRLQQHLYSARKYNKTHVHKWVNSLLKLNLKPNITSIATCDWDKSQKLEIEKIKEFKDKGINLVNHTSGGEGGLGRLVSVKTKNKQSKSLRKSIGKSVSQYDLDGTFIKTFSSIAEVKDYLTEVQPSKIVAVCKNKRRKHFGFRWSYSRVKNLGDMPIHKQTGRPISESQRKAILENLRKYNNWDRDLIGERFGRLVVLEKLPMDSYRYSRCKVLCDCGVEKIVFQSNLTNKKSPTKSCGCLRRENNGRPKK